MQHAKSIIGITGGIGSGKSFVARLFGELGCRVINSDDLTREVYADPHVRDTLKSWWGNEAFNSDRSVNRSVISKRIFNNESERHRLEALIHPAVNERRDHMMRESANDPHVRAFVWDSPLLVETGLHKRCDTVVFVDAPVEMRRRRVMENRGWDALELSRREKLQTALDIKREISEYAVSNAADEAYARDQVRQVLSRILAGTPSGI